MVPSYASVRRFLRRHGLRKRRGGVSASAGVERAEQRIEEREVRSYEAAHVNALWHLDFHHCRRKVLTASGERVVPLLLGVLDDRSRLCCHAQWYLAETAEYLVHGLCQAILKRGLPRALLTDNGAAMLAGETTEGLARLGVVHHTTLPHSPYQNGKQENFWTQIEGRLMAMLEGVAELDLPLLNRCTQAWVEMEYHRRLHGETGQTPIERFLAGPELTRVAPASNDLGQAFTASARRVQRQSDGTLSLRGVRYEVPNRYRHLRRLQLRYASWDRSHALFVDPHTDRILCRLYPVDLAANADGLRRTNEPLDPTPPPAGEMAALLTHLLTEYAATGLPAAYLPAAGEKEKP
jgi:transposase InsO family protein